MSIAKLVWAHNEAEYKACYIVSIHTHSYIYNVQAYLFTKYDMCQIIHIKQVQQEACDTS